MRRMLEGVRLRLLVIPFAAAAVTVACGEGQILQSPTGPSDTLSSTTAVGREDGGATVETRAKGGVPGANESGNGKKPTDSENERPGQGKKPEEGQNPGRSHEDRVVGFVTANLGGALTVNGITVVAGIDAIIRHGNRVLLISDIEVGDHIQARGVMEDTTLVAVEIKVQDTGNDNTDGGEAEGTVSSLSATSSCPVVTFMIGTVNVTTSATTVFDDVTCDALAGKLVRVEGTPSNGSILATKVEGQAGPDEVWGAVFELNCAGSTLKVGPTLALATTVTLTGTTTFTGVANCAALTNGAQVEVEGTGQADGSIIAANVELH